MKPPIDLSFSIVNYDGADLLQNCLSSVFESCTGMSIQVIVVDNGSEDNSLEILKRDYPQAEVIENTQNLGFAAANNQALANCRGRYVVLLNNDTIVQGSAFQSLVSFMDQNPQVGCVGPQLLNADRSVQPSCLRFPDLARSLANFFIVRAGKSVKYVPDPEKAYVHVDAVTGACMILRQDTLKEVGPLDEGYFMYMEEIDWCYRASLAGWLVAYYPESKVVHLGGQTSRNEPGRFHVERRVSRVRFFLKHQGWAAARVADAMVRLSMLVRWGTARRSSRAHRRDIYNLYRERIQHSFSEWAE